ncbi:MAG: ATP-binding protein [Phycisphaerae bacterium]
MSHAAAKPDPALPLRLSLLSDPATLSPVRRAVEAMCVAHGFAPAAVQDVGLCVNEALANVIRHAYAGETGRPIEVEAGVVDGLFRIEIRDFGTGVAPKLPPPPKDPTRPGGLGLVCLVRLMDTVKFEPQPDGMRLTMTRGRSVSPSSNVPVAE